MKWFDFNIGAHVQCQDGQCGNLARLVVDPETRQVTDLIVEQGLLLTQDRVLPIAVVQSALEDQVYLSISSDELDQYPEYRVKEYEEPATGLEQPTIQVAGPHGLYGPTEPVVPMVKRKVREGIVAGQEVIERGMKVSNVDGTIGKIDHVVVDRESKEITHIGVHQGLIFSDQIIIPFSIVEDIHEDGIFVSGSNKDVKKYLVTH